MIDESFLDRISCSMNEVEMILLDLYICIIELLAVFSVKMFCRSLWRTNWRGGSNIIELRLNPIIVEAINY